MPSQSEKLAAAEADMRGGRLRSVLVVGTGLIGTSVALALRTSGVAVWLEDRDEAAVRLATRIGAGEAGRPAEPVDIALVAVPPTAFPEVLVSLQRHDVARTYTDVASIKASPLTAAVTGGADPRRVVGGHPMAGRERSGPAAARADLFAGRPWVITPTEATDDDAVEDVRTLALAVGALPIHLAPAAHDAAVALVSHVPHVAAALVAARLVDAPAAAVALSGTGITDTTRVAEGDAELWADILEANAAPVAAVLAGLRDDLDVLIQALERGESDQPARETVLELLRRGVAGRERLPGKHGTAQTRYATVAVVVPDRPGELARLFGDAGSAGVNIEDLSIEHSPGAPVGVIELAVRPTVAADLADALRARGWTVQP